jgi:hypothetical protein
VTFTFCSSTQNSVDLAEFHAFYYNLSGQAETSIAFKKISLQRGGGAGQCCHVVARVYGHFPKFTATLGHFTAKIFTHTACFLTFYGCFKLNLWANNFVDSHAQCT